MKRIAVVTGGASGIGKAIARRLAEDGFHAVILDRNAEQLKSVVELYRGDGLDVEGRELDLTDATAVRRLVEDLPSVDALVNNAGLFDERGFFDADPQDFRRMYEINLVAVATLTQAVAAGMRPGGKVVNIASRAYLGARNHIHYVASKAALVGYTRACAMELGPRGILVNAVAPGLIDTPMLRALDPERMAAQLALQPTGRAGRPEDIANAVSFLADPKMEFITGQVIFVDGGKSLGGSGA
ncbi:SDR family NAD(P)-dependent oxidoreductase [Parapusillimonas sp. JC17]|uniref:SDR family NAD(P)-dependent oxidoreductase n=1 Tax=Parapusillimonas sp. JC17 TaxID=3445768 RepID=UPI003F9EF61B